MAGKMEKLVSDTIRQRKDKKVKNAIVVAFVALSATLLLGAGFVLIYLV